MPGPMSLLTAVHCLRSCLQRAPVRHAHGRDSEMSAAGTGLPPVRGWLPGEAWKAIKRPVQLKVC